MPMRLWLYKISVCWTLIELIVVLTILVALGGMTFFVLDLQNLRIEGQSPFEIVTQTTLQSIAQAIMGNAHQKGYFSDLGGNTSSLPQTLADLLRVPPTLPLELQRFDPYSQLGWRGPYLLQATGRYGQLSGSSFVFRTGFHALYGQPEDPALLDAWGNPIVLQIEMDGVSGRSEAEGKYARLVSAGPNGRIDTLVGSRNLIPGGVSTLHLSLAECGDDLVYFLRTADTRE
jgi:type II secretory pathway pseudopilin PulG